jgi:hypothetical protein
MKNLFMRKSSNNFKTHVHHWLEISCEGFSDRSRKLEQLTPSVDTSSPAVRTAPNFSDNLKAVKVIAPHYAIRLVAASPRSADDFSLDFELE